MFRRREGHLLAAHPRAFPSSSASSSLLFLLRGVPHSEVRRLWSLLRGGPLSLLLWVCVLFCGPLFATGTCSGADGCVSRLRSSSPTAIVFSIPSFFCVRVPRSLSVQGRSDVFPDRVRVRGHIHFLYFFHFIVHAVCGLRVAPPCFPFLNFQVAWSGVRLVSSVWFLFHS